MGPDFSQIDSPEKAEALVASGDLEKLYLLPLEFGGEDVDLNTIYVPVGVGDVKQSTDFGVIVPLIQSGDVTQYSAEPAYQGKSCIPIRLTIRAWDPKEFETTINIWGDALEETEDS